MTQNRSSSELSTGQLLAITVPVAAAIGSVAWAISTFFIVREIAHKEIELARLKVEAQKISYPLLPTSLNSDRSYEDRYGQL
ncbi:hypothetical protein KDA_69270 [Dictyobacter alpinus]|uniref:Uncharacterized protein n=1 Tax=Dictyobacter alpinus TaxID=2014873 RepID=A0A402BJC9_9CHLR|nr:hypothetical protein [Dictyobacter alpinus]GCE31443.1 hypothetical protein KDA_69270 [Dictyobacter alpinus]